MTWSLQLSTVCWAQQRRRKDELWNGNDNDGHIQRHRTTGGRSLGSRRQPPSQLEAHIQRLLHARVGRDLSLITIERERDRRYDVVDGQQRLTTLNLTLARLRDKIADEAAKAELGNRILPRNVLTGEAETPRLVLRKKDQSFFRKHILEGQAFPPGERDGLESPQRHLSENLEVVDAFCEGKSQQVLKLFANYLLTKVYVVFVTTDSWQSAYRLFNVLNARGMSLSNADLIKNTLFSLLGANAT